METLRTDIAIIGGGLGACAAALAADRLGCRVVLTEETHWVGGQLTNQAVPPDEHPWIEEFGAAASYRTLRREIRNYYRTHVPLTAQARANFVVKRYDANVLFVPMEKTDVQHSHAVVAHMQKAERAEILKRRYSPRQILDLMGHLEFAVGMRLHFLIFAALRSTPFAALPYASKVTGLLEDLEMPMLPLGGHWHRTAHRANR